MNFAKIASLANESGGTLYLMAILLLVALMVIVERTRHLLSMYWHGESLIKMLHDQVDFLTNPDSQNIDRFLDIPHGRMLKAYHVKTEVWENGLVSGHLEEALLHEVPKLDRSLWMLDTVITLAPLLGLFGTIVGMFHTFAVLGDVQNGAEQVTGGIAEALISTACGLFIAMIGLVFFNWLTTRVRLIVHQLETIKIMLINRGSQSGQTQAPSMSLVA